MRAQTNGSCRHGTVLGALLPLSADVDRFVEEAAPYARGPGGRLRRASALLGPPLLAIVLYRVSHLGHSRGWTRTAALLAWFNLVLHKVTISPASCIGGGFYLPHPAAVIFHGRAGEGLTLFPQSACLPERATWNGPAELGPSLGDRVSVGVHAAVIGAVRVGSHTRVAFYSILRRDAPSESVVASAAVRARVVELRNRAGHRA